MTFITICLNLAALKIVETRSIYLHVRTRTAFRRRARERNLSLKYSSSNFVNFRQPTTVREEHPRRVPSRHRDAVNVATAALRLRIV